MWWETVSHHLCGVHIYCKLCRCIPESWAWTIGRIMEFIFCKYIRTWHRYVVDRLSYLSEK